MGKITPGRDVDDGKEYPKTGTKKKSGTFASRKVTNETKKGGGSLGSIFEGLGTFFKILSGFL
ncbi:hypothetical protein AB751O23_AQ_00020 [Chlamydiales bacterium SCGC AB-751-O23]|jgi:hypothetical protein|nr:hypothetical protein AB751O23_AQ_00020 [Chlamydiales bacterium SCGC AB-751-O23]